MDAQQAVFDRLIAEAQHAPLGGWDFRQWAERWHDEPLPWDYRQAVLDRLPHVRALLDMGTGGGEMLRSLMPLPADTVATEGYPPNLPIARAALEPLGVTVVAVHDDELLPVPDARFDLIINRHEAFSAAEVFRVLEPGGTFLTQQVGGNDLIELNAKLQDQVEMQYTFWNSAYAVAQLEQAGLEVIDRREAFPITTFHDVGAVVFFLRATPWQISDFSVVRYAERLRALHKVIQRTGKLMVRSHRFMIEARKPA